MFSDPPPYGQDPMMGHPMTCQPKSATAPPVVYTGDSSHSHPLAPPSGHAPNNCQPTSSTQQSKDNGTSPPSNNGGGITNINNNTNNNTNNNSSNVVVNANVTAGAMSGAGFGGGGNYLCLIGKDLLQRRQWNSGLWSCCNDLAGCTFATVCLPLAMVQVANRMGECACLTCFVPGALVAMRTKVRTMGGIRGSICRDCVLSTCCCWCVLCQMKREMDDMKL